MVEIMEVWNKLIPFATKSAGIEILAGEIELSISDSLASKTVFEPRSGKTKILVDYLGGIVQASKDLDKGYSNLENAIRKGKTYEVNGFVGEISLSSKNLADNLNKYIQFLYADFEKILLKNVNRVDEAEHLLDYFNEVHSHDGDLVEIRNARGHGDGFNLVINNHDGSYSFVGDGDVSGWAKQIRNSYLDLAKYVLQQSKTDDVGIDDLAFPKAERALQHGKLFFRDLTWPNVRSVARNGLIFAALGIAPLLSYVGLELANEVDRQAVVIEQLESQLEDCRIEFGGTKSIRDYSVAEPSELVPLYSDADSSKTSN